MITQPLLVVSNLKIAYPSQKNQSPAATTWAVDDVSFNLNCGEKLALVGESGCGKSTLGRAAMRLLPAQTQIEGEVKFQGESIFNYNRAQLRHFRGEAIALVFQDPMTRLDPLMTIGDHCLETLQAHQPQLSPQEAKARALATLAAVKIPPERWSQYPHQFSGGMRQRVAIALALLLEPKLIVADEPTTSLDVTIASEILGELTRLCQERQMALLLISHDLGMVGKYCDRIAVMYRGKIVETGTVRQVFLSPQAPYTKSLLDAAFHLHRRPGGRGKIPVNLAEESPVLLSVENLKKYYTLESNFLAQFFQSQQEEIKAVDDLTFKLYRGEIFGLVGESGCGKSTLSRAILRLIEPNSGKIEFLGRDLTLLSLRQMRPLRRQIQMIFQDPLACLNPLMTVGESIADPLLIHQICSGQEAQNQVRQMLEKVGLTPADDYIHRYPRQLSGGQQQRVAIARALITRPQLVICDEPVSMLDASVQAQVLELILELKSEFNLTYLFITHDLAVAKFLCDRIAVMNRGKIVEMGDTEQIFAGPKHPYTKTLLQSAPTIIII